MEIKLNPNHDIYHAIRAVWRPQTMMATTMSSYGHKASQWLPQQWPGAYSGGTLCLCPPFSGVFTHWATWAMPHPPLDSEKFLHMAKMQHLRNLILRKIVKIVATRCHIWRLKCTKFDFGWGSAPDPTGGAYSAPPDPLARFKGSYF